MSNLSEADIRKIVAETVEQTLIRLGIPAADPIEVQKDMSHLRGWRTASETVKRQSIITAVGILTAGILGLIWLAIRGEPG